MSPDASSGARETGKPRILVVEDEDALAVAIGDELEAEGYEVTIVSDGVEAEKAGLARRHDLVLLDLMLPRKDGFAVCRSLRAAGVTTPIIALTARATEADKVLGLELGADDYVTKPYSPRELVARIRAALRRANQTPGAADVFDHGDLHVDFRRYEATRGGRPLSLTPTEFRLLASLARHRGEVVPVDRLIEEAWGKDVFLTDRVVYTHINNLRGKVETDPAHPRLIAGVRGVGYRLDI